MRTSEPTDEGFIPRPKYVRTNQRMGKVYHMTRDPVGRVVKVLIGLIGDKAVGQDVVMRRNFTQQGAGRDAIYSQLLAIVPWFQEYYLKARGENIPLTKDIVFDRYHKMYYEDGKPCVSREHYTHDEKLRPLVPQVDRLFHLGKIITEEQAREIGSYAQLALI